MNMESITFLTLMASMFTFMYLGFNMKFQYDYVFFGFSAILSLIIAGFIATTDVLMGFIAGVFIGFLIVYGIGVLALSIVMIMEAMEKGI
jgi:hypothetical protein